MQADALTVDRLASLEKVLLIYDSFCLSLDAFSVLFNLFYVMLCVL